LATASHSSRLGQGASTSLLTWGHVCMSDGDYWDSHVEYQRSPRKEDPAVKAKHYPIPYTQSQLLYKLLLEKKNIWAKRIRELKMESIYALRGDLILLLYFWKVLSDPLKKSNLLQCLTIVFSSPQ
jgi:hypothetical protein